MGKKYSGGSEDVVSKIKMIVSKKWEERFNAQNNLFHEKIYKRMVDEAVLLIKDSWERNAKYGLNTDYPVDVFEVKARSTFFITEDLKLYSDYGYLVTNPETNRCCFFDAFVFTSEEEKQKYIKDILAELPAGTTYEVREAEDLVCGKCLVYAFNIKISMK